MTIEGNGGAQEKVDYYDREINKLRVDIDSAENEKGILKDMKVSVSRGSKADSGIVEDFALRCARDLKRFNGDDVTSARKFVQALFRDNASGEDVFTEQIAVMDGYIADWKAEISQLKEDQRKERQAQ